MASEQNSQLSCSLGPDGLRGRAREWRALLAAACVARSEREGRLVLTLEPRPEVQAELERLIAAERSCCPFLELTVAERGTGEPLVLTVTAPSEAEEILGLLTTLET